jgi:hypothetical protein
MLMYCFFDFVSVCLAPKGLRVQVTMLEDDVLQVFYAPGPREKFTEENSVRKRVSGKPEKQWIDFPIESITDSTFIRIDLGMNPENRKIGLHQIQLGIQKLRIDATFSNHFRVNRFVSVGATGDFHTQKVKGRYDPYIVLKRPVSDIWPAHYRQVTSLKSSLGIWVCVFFGVIGGWRTMFWGSGLTLLESCFVAFVFTLLLIPIFFQVAGLHTSVMESEKRKLNQPPSLRSSDSFGRKFDAYYNDHFGLRPWMVNQLGTIKMEQFHSFPKPEIAQVGKDRFLFYSRLDKEIFPSFSHRDQSSDDELESFYKQQLYLQDKLKEKGIDYVTGFWPNKHTVYPEKLPWNMKKQILDMPSLADQVVAYFRDKTMAFFDVRSELIEAKKRHQVYHKMDTHWNYDGAYVAYEAFCEQTTNTLGLTPIPRSAFGIHYLPIDTSDILEMAGGTAGVQHFIDTVPVLNPSSELSDYQVIRSEDIPENTKVTICANPVDDRVVLVFRDSYTEYLIPYFSRHFRKVVYVWQGNFDMDIVEMAKPDIVISALVERYLSAIVHLSIPKTNDSKKQ